MPLAVAICSAAINCPKDRSIRFFIIECGFDAELKKRVEKSLDLNRQGLATISWLGIPIERLSKYKLGHGYTTAMTFARLLIPELLPRDICKAIYLDCDVAVIGNISELWDIGLGTKALLAGRDTTGTVSQPTGLKNFAELGIPADSHYFNAGVLVINLEVWRTRNLTETLLNYLESHRDIIQLADQEALNAILWNDWAELDYSWNWQIVWRDYRLGRAMPSWIPPMQPKRIIHFITGEKPWKPGCDYEERKYFFEYLDRTDWAAWRVSASEELFGRARRFIYDLRKQFGQWRRLR
jgi:lipopolysaccharide biosynthesis glycosyltransferase